MARTIIVAHRLSRDYPISVAEWRMKIDGAGYLMLDAPGKCRIAAFRTDESGGAAAFLDAFDTLEEALRACGRDAGLSCEDKFRIEHRHAEDERKAA